MWLLVELTAITCKLFACGFNYSFNYKVRLSMIFLCLLLIIYCFNFLILLNSWLLLCYLWSMTLFLFYMMLSLRLRVRSTMLVFLTSTVLQMLARSLNLDYLNLALLLIGFSSILSSDDSE